MPRAARLASAFVLATSALIACPLAAQTEFAVPLGRGQLRVDFVPVWSSWSQRWQPGTTGTVPLASDYTTDSLGVATLPFLTTWQDTLRTATAIPGFSLNLGHPLVALNASVRTMPIAIEYGLASRLSVGFTVPIVRSRMDVGFQIDTAAARRSNVGLNPGIADTSRVNGFRLQMDSVLAALQTEAASGPAALRAEAQAQIAALKPFLAASFSPFLPRGGTAAAESIAARISAADSTYARLAAQYDSLGIPMPAINKPFAMPDTTALQTADLVAYFLDPALGVGSDSFATIVRTRLGDVTAHATYQLAEGRRYRGQIVVTVRFPTGVPASANDIFDVGTGTHEYGLEGALANDFLLSSAFLVHAVARAGASASDQVPMRVTPPTLPIAPLTSVAEIKRQPAPYLALDLDPTWMLDDAFSVRLAYGFFTQGATKHSYVNAGDELRVGLPASVLDEDTAMRWMRLGAEVTFVTTNRYAAGQASLPYSISVGYDHTFWGAGGRVPKLSDFHLSLRAYFRLFR